MWYNLLQQKYPDYLLLYPKQGLMQLVLINNCKTFSGFW